ncbi:YidC/Oxa1 family membrane protein insertase [Miniphocaeibacter massiliensis]|uniref:YidC/Oxa1 family membrane protein insertase n=1 Tax=Miniphocaeibacter massiliensis TaxID=2041841 RepID=UPI000C1BDD4B|nr:YidC/Oxa1 family membrane protein insertase [Miniphocaeibacter massiliensis]
MNFLSPFIGKVLEYIYTFISKIGTEPKNISYFAISILVLTLIYKLLMLPVTLSNAKMQKVNAKLQPEMEKLKKKYKHDPQLYQQKVMELQREMGFNPLASCLPLIIQMLIIISLFPVMKDPMKYMDISKDIARNFFWIKDIAGKDPTVYTLPIILAVTQFLYTKVTMAKPQKKDGEKDPMQSMNFTMQYAMPIMMFFFAKTYQAGLALYWTFGNIVEMSIRLILDKSKREEEIAEKQIKKKKEEIEVKKTSKNSGNKKKGA